MSKPSHFNIGHVARGKRWGFTVSPGGKPCILVRNMRRNQVGWAYWQYHTLGRKRAAELIKEARRSYRMAGRSAMPS